MQIHIIKSVEEAAQAQWLTVVIDVFRAFSTEVYIIQNGAKYIIPVASLEEAYALKQKHPDYILIWERGWIKPDWFDYGNSPTELLHIDFTDTVVIHTTSNGTQWLIWAKHADDIITWSFVNAWAILRYIEQQKPAILSLVATSHLYTEENEDIVFANYIRDILQGTVMSVDEVKKVIQTTSAYQYLFDEIWVPQTDFELCLDIDKYNFVIKQIEYNGMKILTRVDI